MPESLQESDSGYMLEERADACDAWADEIANFDVPECEEVECDEDDEDYDECVEEMEGDCETLISDAVSEIAGLGPEV
jgi:hypothetical protein